MKVATDFVALVSNAKGVKYHSKLHCVGALVFDLISSGAVSLDNKSRLSPNSFDSSKLSRAETVIYDAIQKSPGKKLSWLLTKVYVSMRSGELFQMVRSGESSVNIEELRAEILEDDNVTEESAVILLLLKQSRCLDYYFSKYEQKTVREKLKSLSSSADYRTFSTISRTIMVLDALTWF